MGIVNNATVLTDYEGSPSQTNIVGGAGNITTSVDVFIEGAQSSARRVDNATDRGGYQDTIGPFNLSDTTLSVKMWWNHIFWPEATDCSLILGVNGDQLIYRQPNNVAGVPGELTPAFQIDPPSYGWRPIWYSLGVRDVFTTTPNTAIINEVGWVCSVNNVGGNSQFLNVYVDEITYWKPNSIIGALTWSGADGSLQNFLDFEDDINSGRQGVVVPSNGIPFGFARIGIDDSAVATSFTIANESFFTQGSPSCDSDQLGIIVNYTNPSSTLTINNATIGSTQTTNELFTSTTNNGAIVGAGSLVGHFLWDTKLCTFDKYGNNGTVTITNSGLNDLRRITLDSTCTVSGSSIKSYEWYGFDSSSNASVTSSTLKFITPLNLVSVTNDINSYKQRSGTNVLFGTGRGREYTSGFGAFDNGATLVKAIKNGIIDGNWNNGNNNNIIEWASAGVDSSDGVVKPFAKIYDGGTVTNVERRVNGTVDEMRRNCAEYAPIQFTSLSAGKTFTLDTITFSGYEDSVATITGREGVNGAAGTDYIKTPATVYNKSGGTVTLNIVGGDTPPWVYDSEGSTTVVNNVAQITLTRLLGNTEIKVLENPSPYSATTLPAPTAVSVSSTEAVSADTFIGNGTNYISYNTGGATVTIDLAGSFTYSGVLTDASGSLSSGDKVHVVVRNNGPNPTLQRFDEFTVSSTTSTSITTTIAPGDFTSVFGNSLSGSNSLTVTIEKVNASYKFNAAANSIIDILAFRTGSDPVLITGQTAETGSIPITQVGDRNYRDPA